MSRNRRSIRSRSRSSKKIKGKKPSARLRRKSASRGVKTTKGSGKNRRYKSSSMLKRQIKRKSRSGSRKRRSRSGRRRRQINVDKWRTSPPLSTSEEGVRENFLNEQKLIKDSKFRKNLQKLSRKNIKHSIAKNTKIIDQLREGLFPKYNFNILKLNLDEN